MTSKTLRLSTLALLTALSSTALTPARADDFQTQVLRRAAQQRAGGQYARALGMKVVGSLEQLDLTQELSNAELAKIENGAGLLAGSKLKNAEIGTQMFQRLEAHQLSQGNRLKAVFIYLGVTSGDVVGLTGDLALAIGHDRLTGEVAVYPMLIVRLKAFVVGTDFHFGVGAIEAGTPALTAGLMLGGSFIVGAGVGAGGNLSSSHPAGEAYIELKIGASIEAGGYIGVVL